MKKFFKPQNLPVLTLLAGGIGLVLHFILLTTGIDDRGFFISYHPADIALWVLTAAFAAMLLVLTKGLHSRNKYRVNFPPSTIGSIGTFAGAAGIGVTSLLELMSAADRIASVSAVLGLISAALLLFIGHCRRKGLQPTPMSHAIISLYLMLRLISQYRHWSSDPAVLDYCFPLLASVCLMLAVYHRATFDANFGKRRSYACFNLLSVYFCCICLTGLEDILFFLPVGLWMVTDLCDLSTPEAH